LQVETAICNCNCLGKKTLTPQAVDACFLGNGGLDEFPHACTALERASSAFCSYIYGW